jgi:hypothetical protein
MWEGRGERGEGREKRDMEGAIEGSRGEESKSRREYWKFPIAHPLPQPENMSNIIDIIF